MKCIFLSDIEIENNLIKVKDKNFHHLKNVLRIKKGEKLDIKDNFNVYNVALHESAKDELIFEIIDKRDIQLNPNNIILCQSIIKLDAFELILQKATEIGVHKIIPYISNRNIIKLNIEKIQDKMKRWRKIIEESSQQCSRDYIPAIEEPINDFTELSSYEDYSPILLHEKQQDFLLKEAFGETKHNILMLIGPEGGFDEKEVKMAEDLNFKTAGLTGNILRSETAAIFALSSYFFHFSSGHQSTS